MKIDSNTIYYFFSTSAQVYAALLAILLTLLLFKIQRLLDKHKEQSRATLEKFIEQRLENADTRYIQDRIIWERYWGYQNDSERIKYIKQAIFGLADVMNPPFLPGTDNLPPTANRNFLRTLWIHISELDALSVKTGKTRKQAISTFILGAILICFAILLLVTPDFLKMWECLEESSLVTGILLVHLGSGIIFFFKMFCVLKESIEV